jgi:hypothetical protein
MGWPGRASAQAAIEAGEGRAKEEDHAMSQNLSSALAVIGIDIGKNSFHVVGLDERGAIVLRSLALSFKPRWIEDLALV